MTKQTTLAAAASKVQRRNPAAADIEPQETAQPRQSLPVDIDTLDHDHRLRPGLDTAKLEALTHSLDRNGLQSPILIRPSRTAHPVLTDRWGDENPGRFAIIAGAHRVAAANKLGWSSIEAIFLDPSPHQSRLIEIDENLVRTDNTPLDRACFLAEAKRINNITHHEPSHGGDRRSSSAAHTKTESFADETAPRIGLAPRTIRRAITIGEALSRDHALILAATPLAKRETDLHQLACLAPDRFDAAMTAIRTAIPPPDTLKQILDLLPPETGELDPNSPEDDEPDGDSDSEIASLRRLWENTKIGQAWATAAPATRATFIAWLGTQH